MTDKEINEAIAEKCGRKPGAYYCSICRECVPIETVTSGGYHEKCAGKVHLDLPDYARDLNAMHGAESLIGTSLDWSDRYIEILRHNGNMRGIHATARQRAEAFLRTFNLWKE